MAFTASPCLFWPLFGHKYPFHLLSAMWQGSIFDNCKGTSIAFVASFCLDEHIALYAMGNDTVNRFHRIHPEKTEIAAYTLP